MQLACSSYPSIGARFALRKLAVAMRRGITACALAPFSAHNRRCRTQSHYFGGWVTSQYRCTAIPSVLLTSIRHLSSCD